MEMGGVDQVARPVGVDVGGDGIWGGRIEVVARRCVLLL